MTKVSTDQETSQIVRLAVPEVTQEDIEAVGDVMRRGWLTSGPEGRLLERDLATFLKVPHVVATSSCTHALEIAIAWLGLRPGARVAVPTWTFAASALAPYRLGCQPVLIDSEPSTLNMSPESLAAAIDDVDAVVAVHFGGVPVDEKIHGICANAGVPVIEDAAHALGGSDSRGMIGGGDSSVATCLSFYATKNLTGGEGGALTTHDAALADFAARFRIHGLIRDGYQRSSGEFIYDVDVPGIKANLSDVLAALARSQLARFKASQRRRRSLYLQYRTMLAQIDDIRIVPETIHGNSADHLMLVILPEGSDRGAVMDFMLARGIETSVHFRPLHDLSWFRMHVAVGPSGTTVADEVAPRALTLPLHVGLDDAAIIRVCTVLSDALAARVS